MGRWIEEERWKKEDDDSERYCYNLVTLRYIKVEKKDE